MGKTIGGIVNGNDQLTLGTSVKLLNQQQLVFSGRFHGANAFSAIPLAPNTSSNGSSDLFVCLLDSAGNYQGITSGISQNYLSSMISIYPNPVADFIDVKHFSLENINYKIYNELGALVLSGQMNKQIDSSILPTGVYQILFISEENHIQSTQKFIKQ
jgi:hypothetical protein